MGAYIYTIRKKTVKATLLPENKEVTIALAQYLCRDSYRIHEDKDYGRERAAMTRAYNLVHKKGFKPDFYTTSFDYDGTIYTFDGRSAFSDGSGSMGTYGGYLMKINNRYFVLPIDEKGNFNLKKHFPDLYKNYTLPHTQVYVKMNERYTATARNLYSLEDYMFEFGKDQVDVKLLGIHSVGEDVPGWFKDYVQQLINKRLLMDKKALKDRGYADWFIDMQPEYYDNLK